MPGTKSGTKPRKKRPGPGGGGGGRPKSGEQSVGKSIARSSAAPELPWAKAVADWMGKSTKQRVQVVSTFRHHYLEPNFVYDPEPEAMVQLVLTFIAKEGSRREAPDDRAALAAALRMRHGSEHFSRMADEMARFWSLLDGTPDRRHLFDFVNMCTSMSEIIQSSTSGTQESRMLYSKENSGSGADCRETVENSTKSVLGQNSSDTDKGGIRKTSLLGVGIDGGNRISRADINTVLAVHQLSFGSGTTEVDVLESLWDAELIERNPLKGFNKFCFSHRSRLLDVLQSVDIDDRGTVTRTEMARSLMALRMPLQSDAISDFVAQLDANGDGDIAYQEFGIVSLSAFYVEGLSGDSTASRCMLDLEAAAEATALVPKAAFDHVLFEADPIQGLRSFLNIANINLVDLFVALDTDRSGEVSTKELIEGLRKLNVPIASGGEQVIMTFLDPDGVGKINYHEQELGEKRYRESKDSQSVKTSEINESQPQRLTLEALMDLTLHCHYVTRP